MAHLGNGSSKRARSLATSPAVAADGRQLLLLVGIGATIAVVQTSLRFSLGLPGHHGLEAMALMMIGRLLAEGRWSATLIAATAGVTALALGAGHDPLRPLFYVIPGLSVDLLLRWSPPRSSLWLLVPAIGGLAWASRPLCRWLVASATGIEFGSLLRGLALPTLTHLLFGAVGATLGLALWRARERAKER